MPPHNDDSFKLNLDASRSLGIAGFGLIVRNSNSETMLAGQNLT